MQARAIDHTLRHQGPGFRLCLTCWANRDHFIVEMLDPVFAALRREPIAKAPITIHLDHSVAPTVVLVVEDEMLLRMRAVDMVEDAGYACVEAVDADQAIAILESRSDIALLFTDIQMPGQMDGLGLAHAVHDRWPPIKIILVSGQLKLTTTDIPADSHFFGKPVQATAMIAEMRNMIGHT